MKQTRVLVTGGAGFIGSHLVDRLLREGFHVTVVDNLSTGRRENVPTAASLCCVDLCSPELAAVFYNQRPQVVFHLAAQVSVVSSLADPCKDAETNIIGSLNLLRQCQRFGVERFVYSSTGGALYGEPKNLPCAETHPVRPCSPYGVSKYAVELYLHCFSVAAGFRYSVLRYGNVYGPRQDPSGEAGVIAIFARRMLDGDQVAIYGDGQQERDFVYVDDVVEANVMALHQEENNVYNIGTGRGSSVNTVFELLTQLTKHGKSPKYEPARKGEVQGIYLDVGRARQELGWVSRVSLENGLLLTVEHFRESKAS